MVKESILSQYGKKFVSSNQSRLLDIIESYKGKLSQEQELYKLYKKIFNRSKLAGICGYLCQYVQSNDLLSNKEKFLEEFEFNNGKKISQLLRNVMTKEIDPDTSSFNKENKSIQKFINFLEDKINTGNTTKDLKNDIEKVKEKHIDLLQKFVDFDPNEKKEIILSEEMKNNIEGQLIIEKSKNAYILLIFKSHSPEQAGHALLIRQNANNSFSFYDPNRGAVFDLTERQLCHLVDETFRSYNIYNKLLILPVIDLDKIAQAKSPLRDLMHKYNYLEKNTSEKKLNKNDRIFSYIKSGSFMGLCSEVNRNTNFNIYNENGQTPLTFAIKCYEDSDSNLMKKDRSKIVNTLLENICKNTNSTEILNVKDNYGCTAYMYAYEKQLTNVTDFLKSQGADVNLSLEENKYIKTSPYIEKEYNTKKALPQRQTYQELPNSKLQGITISGGENNRMLGV